MNLKVHHWPEAASKATLTADSGESEWQPWSGSLTYTDAARKPIKAQGVHLEVRCLLDQPPVKNPPLLITSQRRIQPSLLCRAVLCK